MSLNERGGGRRGACVRAVLGAAAVALANGLHAAGLFLPVDVADAVVDAVPGVKSASVPRRAAAAPDAWERRVYIARHELAAAREDVEGAGTGRLLLNVTDGVRLNVVVERTATIKRGYSLSGRVAGGDVGFVTLVVHDEAVAGSIWTPDAAYELHHLGGGVHVLREVTNAPPVECGGTAPSELATAEATAQVFDEGQGDDEGSVVDILMVWTPAAEAEDACGGAEPQVLSRIDLFVAYANDAFERSGAFVSLNVVGAEKVDYVETGNIRTDLARLADRDDGHMDSVHHRRDALGADLVYLLTEDRSGGIANLFGPFGVGLCRDNGHVFAHEVGHNMGLRHERYNTPAWGYANGYTTELCDATIMSYGEECSATGGRRIPFYASPWRYGSRDGHALGVTRFSKRRSFRGPADAVLTLNRNRRLVANFRTNPRGE